MEISLKKAEQNKYNLTVELGRDDLAGYVKKAEDRIVGEVQVDGFRRGKAPKDIVQEKVGKEYVLEQALNIALQDSLARALDEQKLEVMEVSGLNIKENSGSKLLYTVTVTSFPSVNLTDISEIKIKKRKVEVQSQEVEEAINFSRIARAKFLPKNGAIEKGDRVEIDFEVTSGGLPIEGGISKSHPLVVGDNKFIPGFEDRLIGMKINDEKKFELNVSPDYFHKNIAGKKLDCSVKIVNVQTVEKPFLDEEFVKSLGKFKNLEEFRKSVINGLTQEKEIKEKERLRLEIIARISEKSKMELPEDMVDDKLNDMIGGFDNDLHLKGMELSFYLAHLGKTEDDLRKDWWPEAEKQTRYMLILHKIAKLSNLYPTQTEIEDQVEQTIQVLVLRGQINPEKIDMEKVRNVVNLNLTNEKVFSFLEKRCIV